MKQIEVVYERSIPEPKRYLMEYSIMEGNIPQYHMVTLEEKADIVRNYVEKGEISVNDWRYGEEVTFRPCHIRFYVAHSEMQKEIQVVQVKEEDLL